MSNKSNTATKFTPTEQAKLMADIAGLHFKRYDQATIAQKLSQQNPEKPITQQLVSYYLKKIRKAWLKESVEEFDAAKAQELARINHLEETYWRGWERSLLPVKVKKSRKANDKATAELSEYESLGDVKFLEGVRWCYAKRAEIRGFDAPKKISGMIFDGKIDYSTCSLEQLHRLRMGENPLEVLKPDQIK
jgi:hypothetical protein